MSRTSCGTHLLWLGPALALENHEFVAQLHDARELLRRPTRRRPLSNCGCPPLSVGSAAPRPAAPSTAARSNTLPPGRRNNRIDGFWRALAQTSCARRMFAQHDRPAADPLAVVRVVALLQCPSDHLDRAAGELLQRRPTARPNHANTAAFFSPCSSVAILNHLSKSGLPWASTTPASSAAWAISSSRSCCVTVRFCFASACCSKQMRNLHHQHVVAVPQQTLLGQFLVADRFAVDGGHDARHLLPKLRDCSTRSGSSPRLAIARTGSRHVAELVFLDAIDQLRRGRSRSAPAAAAACPRI